MKDGIYFDLSRADYDNIVAANWSTIKWLDVSPAHYQQQLLEWDHDTAAKKRGRVGHLSIFEPDRWRGSVAVWDGDRRAGKEWEKFKARNEGKELLKEDEYQQALEIQLAVRKNPVVAPFLTGGKGEVSVVWTYRQPAIGDIPAIEIKCKSRLDYLRPDCIVDLKTARSAAPRRFGQQAGQLGYHGQCAMYHDAVATQTGKRLPYFLVVVEPEPPYAVTVFRVNNRELRAGRDFYQSLLFKLAHCRRTDEWPAYATEVVDLELPTWICPPDEDDPTGMGLEFPKEEVA